MAQCGHVEMTTHWLLSLSIAIIASVSMFIYPMTFPKFRMEELLIKRNMSMANQECNHVNHFELETKSTPGWEKFMQPYQSNHKSVVRLYQKKHFKELDMTSILSFLLFLVVFLSFAEFPSVSGRTFRIYLEVNPNMFFLCDNINELPCS
jgi:hypothetical protein